MKIRIKKMELVFSLILLSIFLLLSTIALAIPNSLTIQGKLTNLAGSSQVGTFNFTFKIYDNVTAGNELWAVTNISLTTDANGVYDVILNGINLSFADQYYLGISVQGENESVPRINLTSAPYSFRANTSEALNPNASYFVRNISISGHTTIGNGTSLLEISTQLFNFSSTTGNLNINGTVTAKSFVGDGSQLTGIISVTPPFNSSGSNAYLNDTTARLGLGMSTPTEKLRVEGNVSITGNLFINETLNFTASSGNLRIAGNITLGDRIVFRLGEVIDNLVDGWLKVTGALNVTSSLFVTGGANISGDFSINNIFNITASSGNTNVGGILDAGGLRVAGNVVQLVKDAWSLSNFTTAYDNRADRFGLSNLSSALQNNNLTANLSNVSVVSLQLGWTNLTNYPGACPSGQFVATVGDTLTCVTPSPSSGGGWTDDDGIIRLTTLTDIVSIGSNASLAKLYVNDSSAAGAFLITNASGTTIFFVNGSTARIGIGNTTTPVDTLTIIGSTSVFGSLNATFINATEIRQGTNIVQTINAVFNLLNLTNYFGDSGFNGSVLRVGNISNIRESLYNLANFTSNYDARSDRFGLSNLTSALQNNNLSANFTNVSIVSLPLGWTNLTNYPGACPAGQYLTQIDDTLTCTAADTSATDDWSFGNNESAVLDNATILRTGNISNIRESLYNLVNFTSNLNSANASIALWNVSGTNIHQRDLSGRVGIGTIVPGQALHVVGSANVSATVNAPVVNTTLATQNITITSAAGSVIIRLG